MTNGVTCIYNNGDYEVKYNKNFRGRRKFRIVNTKNPNLHTHRWGKKESIDLCNFAKHRNLPQDSDIDYLISLSRLLYNDDPFKWRVDSLIETKKDKKRGNQKHYINVQRGRVNQRY